MFSSKTMEELGYYYYRDIIINQTGADNYYNLDSYIFNRICDVGRVHRWRRLGLFYKSIRKC